MSARRGFFRLWVVGSVVWIAGWLWAYPWPLEGAFLCTFGLTDNPFCKYRDPYSVYPTIALLGPVVALFVGLAVGWIVDGFSKRPKSN